MSPRRKLFGRLSILAGNAVQVAGIAAACLALAAARSARSATLAVVALVAGWVLLYFLLPCDRPLDCGTSAWHSLRSLHGWWNWESRRVARRAAVVVRASSFSGGANGEGLDATGQPNGQSDYVVGGSDVLGRCANPGSAVGMARGRAVEQTVRSVCTVVGGRNVVQQLEEPHWGLCQGPARARQSVSSATGTRRGGFPHHSSSSSSMACLSGSMRWCRTRTTRMPPCSSSR